VQEGEEVEDAKIRRLEKNRLSAKESRYRKKQYMTKLEERNQMLEKERARLLRKINNLEDMNKLNGISRTDTINQLIQGKQQLFDRLEQCLEAGGTQSQFEINNIIAQLQLRSGSYGMERKNLINNLIKSVIDLAFPNIVKYLFWAC
jgi:hypothetical protein